MIENKQLVKRICIALFCALSIFALGTVFVLAANGGAEAQDDIQNLSFEYYSIFDIPIPDYVMPDGLEPGIQPQTAIIPGYIMPGEDLELEPFFPFSAAFDSNGNEIIFAPFDAVPCSGFVPTEAVPYFCLRLFSEREIYNTTNSIPIWATLEYSGNDADLTINHALPDMIFTISGDNGFNLVYSFRHTFSMIETGTGEVFYNTTEAGALLYDSFPYSHTALYGVFSSNEIAQHHYAGWGWKNGLHLYLPAGEYTITVHGAFYTLPMTYTQVLYSQLNIMVVE